jgi:hypothetical protein
MEYGSPLLDRLLTYGRFRRLFRARACGDYGTAIAPLVVVAVVHLMSELGHRRPLSDEDSEALAGLSADERRHIQTMCHDHQRLSVKQAIMVLKDPGV